MIYIIRTEPEKRLTRLKMLIITKKLTQKKVAEIAGLEEWQISQLASGENNDCYLSTAKKICNALDCNLHDVFGD